MSAENILQTVVGKVGEFYEWLADRLNDDAARAEVLIDLGLPPNIAVGQPFPQHQIKGINEYRKTISIETEVSAGQAKISGRCWACRRVRRRSWCCRRRISPISAPIAMPRIKLRRLQKGARRYQRSVRRADQFRESVGRRGCP